MPKPSTDTLLGHRHAISTIRALSAQVDDLNERLLAAEKCRTRFISNALNELNNPMAAVIGLTDQLLGDDAPSAASIRESLQWIRSEAMYLDFQLRNVFMAGSLETGVAGANPARCDLVGLLNAVVTRLLASARSRSVNLTLNGRPGLLSAFDQPAAVEVDAALFSLVAANLIDNAIKFSPVGATVRVALAVEDQAIDLRVEDDGPGLPGGQLNRAFDRCWQADASSTRTHRGMGLGLAVAARCIELMKGELQIRSGAGDVGASVRVRLPVDREGLMVDATDDNVYLFDVEESGDEAHAERW